MAGQKKLPLPKLRATEDICQFDIRSSVSEIKFVSPDDPKNPDYNVTFRGGDPEKRKAFHQQKFIMPISIGQRVHENGKMAGTLRLVNRSFQSGYILIDDVIQRHTLKIFHPDKSSEQLYEMCLRDGDEWLNRYEPFCKKLLKIDHKIIRWEQWLAHKDFKKSLEYVKKLRKNNACYNESFDRNINEYIGRIFQRDSSVNYDWAYQCCLEYLEEECAAMCLWLNLGVGVEVYPSNRNHAMSATNELLIHPRHGKLLDHVGLRFQKRNSINQVEERQRESVF